jgi:enoyl-CoA hydratase
MRSLPASACDGSGFCPSVDGRTHPDAASCKRKRVDVTDYQFLRYETFHDDAIARITLDRPATRNAQHRGLLVELDTAFARAEADDAVRVVILAGAGPLFSSGHDLGSKEAMAELAPGPDQHPTMRINGATRHSAEKRMLQEWHYYFNNTLRWRNLRKITVAQVQGTTFAAGLMLIWACDLIVAADDACFADVVGTRLGMCGVEYFGHPWEFGPRRAKELLLTGDSIDAQEAHRLGMVSKIFPRAELEERTLQFAARLARTPTMAALLIKESVNQTVDNMGFYNSLQACFTLHQLNHSHWAELNDDKLHIAKPEHGVPLWSQAPPVTAARADVADPTAVS